jgi:histidinol-phosphate aminotransferase
MQLSRRAFVGVAGLGATAAASSGRLLEALEPPRSLQPSNLVILNSNENPYGAFPSVLREIERAASLVHRYPDDHYVELWELLAKLHRCRTDEITLGSGSTDILRMTAEAFGSRNKTVLQAAPTFEALAMYARRRGANVVTVPLKADYSHDMDGMIAKLDATPDIVYICNPNNPTATLTTRNEIERLTAKLPADSYLLIDEAYHHFAAGAPGYRSFADDRVDHPRVVVARTFSKVHGLAGLRVGYAVAQAATIQKLQHLQVFDNPNVVAVRAAIAALQDTAALNRALARNTADRQEFLKQAGARQLTVIPSHTNFVMFDTRRPVTEVRDAMRQRSIMIGRVFPPLNTYARISLGTPGEMRAFWTAWDQISA